MDTEGAASGSITNFNDKLEPFLKKPPNSHERVSYVGQLASQQYTEGAVSGGVEDFNENWEPLLKKSTSSDGRESNGGQLASQQYFPNIGYNCGPRPFRDILFIVIFGVSVLASVGFGIFAIVSYNTNYMNVESAIYNGTSGYCYWSSGYQRTSSSAEKHVWKGRLNDGSGSGKSGFREGSFLSGLSYGSKSLLPQEGLLRAGVKGSFVIVLVSTLVITLFVSVPIFFGLLWLLRTYARQLVYACLPFFILIPVLLNVFWFVACTVSKECREASSLPGRIILLVFVFLLCGIFAWIIYSNWDRVELTIRIMQTASEALLRNIGLLLVLPCLSIGLLVYIVPFLVFLLFAYMNGKVVPTSAAEQGLCGAKFGTDCCTWKVSMWVPAYYVLAISTVLWSAMLIAEAQVYTISGTIAQWYFAATGSRVTGSIRGSLRNAFGPSFGTVCFSGLVLSFVRIIRAAVDSAQNDEINQGFFYIILRCCINWVLFVIKFLNKFTINFAAITGGSFCASAKMSYDLLRRNLLSPVLVEIISTRLLGGIVFVLSVVYAIVVCVILKAATMLEGNAYIVTVIAWFLLFIVLILFCQILDNVIDTVYICFAIDKDSGAVSKPEVHDVYVLLHVSHDQPATLAIHQP